MRVDRVVCAVPNDDPCESRAAIVRDAVRRVAEGVTDDTLNASSAWTLYFDADVRLNAEITERSDYEFELPQYGIDAVPGLAQRRGSAGAIRLFRGPEEQAIPRDPTVAVVLAAFMGLIDPFRAPLAIGDPKDLPRYRRRQVRKALDVDGMAPAVGVIS
jgi:hypothetical protein